MRSDAGSSLHKASLSLFLLGLTVTRATFHKRTLRSCRSLTSSPCKDKLSNRIPWRKRSAALWRRHRRMQRRSAKNVLMARLPSLCCLTMPPVSGRVETCEHPLVVIWVFLLTQTSTSLNATSCPLLPTSTGIAQRDMALFLWQSIRPPRYLAGQS